MKTLKKNYEICFQRLAELQGIQVKFGWKKKVATFFNVAQSMLSNWFHRGCPELALQHAEKHGYPRDMWYVAPEDTEYPGENACPLPPTTVRNPNSVPSYTLPPNATDRYAPTVLYCPQNSVIDRHIGIIQKFKDKQTAMEINSIMLEIEALQPGHLKFIKRDLEIKVQTLRDSEETKKNASNQ